MAFTHTRGSSAASAGGQTTVAVTLGAAPATGSLVCVAVVTSVSTSAMTVKDSNNNSYTKSTNSPSTFVSSAGMVWLFYLLSAPSNATAAITATWTTSASTNIWADVFAVSGGTAAFDKDAKSTGSTGTTINTPSITPTSAGSLVYASAGTVTNITAPAAGATLGAWTGAGGAITGGDMSEYALSITGAQAVQFTQSSGGWSAMSMAFSFTATAAENWLKESYWWQRATESSGSF